MRLLAGDLFAGVGNLLETAALSENLGVLGSGGANLPERIRCNYQKKCCHIMHSNGMQKGNTLHDFGNWVFPVHHIKVPHFTGIVDA